MKKPPIKIIGCGVSGLTVGVLLLEAGYQVEIITEFLPKHTTSAKAAAIWFPYEVKPIEKVNYWSKVSFEKFAKLCEVPQSGVSMVSLVTLIEKESDAWWKGAIPKEAIRPALASELPPQYPLGYIMEVPLVETQIYLDYLLQEFQQFGGQLSIQKVNDLTTLSTTEKVIINCTGLHSRELAKDNSLYPVQGQIIKVDPQADIPCIVTDFAFDAAGEEFAYLIPRKDCLVLGGTAVKHAEDRQPDAEVTRGIIDRCRAVVPNLKAVDIQSVEVGLRPGRPEIRLEREGNIIHNYGHGGAGFTVSWGCAEAVRGLL